MTTKKALLAEIARFLRDHRMTESAFSRAVANDGKFVSRLRDGADLTVGKLDAVRAFMATERGNRRRSRRSAARRAA